MSSTPAPAVAPLCTDLKQCPRCENPPHLKTCQCQLRPYKEGCAGSKGGTTPHHCVPDHCFRVKGTKNYYQGGIPRVEGLCVCVDGKDKSTTKQHGKLHQKFDERETGLADANASAELGALEDAAVDVIGDETKCDKSDLKVQIRNYHQSKGLGPKLRFRADPFGTAKVQPSYSAMGTSNITTSIAPSLMT
jgi:hypothetical protein